MNGIQLVYKFTRILKKSDSNYNEIYNSLDSLILGQMPNSKHK